MRVGLPLLAIAAAAYFLLNSKLESTGDLRVTTSVPGAEILVGGIQTGLVSDTTVNLPVGRAIITVRKAHFISDPEFTVVDIKRKSTNRVSFMLRDSGAAVVRDTIPPLRPAHEQLFSTGLPVRSIPAGSPRAPRHLVD
jgi:hypothetical protein